MRIYNKKTGEYESIYEEYIRQIQSYDEKAKHDDSPDSAACAIRLLEGYGIETVSGIVV